MKKIFIGVIIVVVVAIILSAIFEHSGAGSGSTSGGASLIKTPPTPTAIYQMPTSTMLTLGTPRGSVTMKNFYLTSPGAEEQFIVLATNSKYEITYDPGTNVFYIYVAQAPYDANRTQAEADFVTQLGVSKTDACKLSVGEALGSQKTPGLSFCSTGVIQ